MGIREDNQTLDTVGRARYLKQEGKLVNFKIKQEMTRQNMKQNVNRDRRMLGNMVWQNPLWHYNAFLGIRNSS